MTSTYSVRPELVEGSFLSSATVLKGSAGLRQAQPERVEGVAL